ncbi:MAG: fibronectin type III domain-containing protein [Verrucomicrobiota bacterium]
MFLSVRLSAGHRCLGLIPLLFLLACGVLPSMAQYEIVPASPQWHPVEILNWSPATDPDAPFNRCSVPLSARFTAPTVAENPALSSAWNVNPHARPGEARVQAVTTFNTIPAGSPNGWRTTRLYAPSIWQYTDNMVFWGSSDRDTKTILTPTAHLMDAAHRNGVRIYGKIFFAFNQSPDSAAVQRIRDLLVKNGNTFPVADKLIEAAVYFGFDGWFINQETSGTNGTDAQNMRDFIAYFRSRSVALGAPHLRITWYDAMTENGSRSFQNAFTNSNDGFMKSGTSVTQTGNTLAAHEMFLNFWWYYNASNLSDSRSLAITRGVNPYDLYAGIWTENYRNLGNTPDPNGGNNIAITWDHLFPESQPHHLSLALFGAETPFVKSSSPATLMTQDQLYWSGPNQDPADTDATGTPTPNWSGIAHYIPANSPVTTLPFVTNFNAGQGELYKINGTTSMTGPWTNLSVQDILPTWRWIVLSSGAKTITPGLDFTEAYYGGSSLKLAGSLQANLPQEVKLYQTRLPVTANTNLRLIYKAGAFNASQIEIGYAFEDAPAVMFYSTAATAASTAWTTMDFPIGAHAGKSLALITLRVSSGSAVASYTANIGRIQISSGISSPPAPPAALLLEGKARNPDEAFSTQLRLKWDASPDPVLHYNLYYRKDLAPATHRTWIGATPNRYFFAQDVRRTGFENEGYVEVEAVGPGYGVSNSITTPLATFAFESIPNLHHPVIDTYPVQAPMVVLSSGSTGSNPAALAFDNNIGTFTEPQPGVANGAWVGLDLGAGNAKQITAIQFVPRNSWATRMTGGVFQGSNSPDFSNAVQLAKLDALPPQGVFTTLLVGNATEFRYLRYLSPGGGYANVAEIRFYTTGPPVPPLPPAGLQGVATGTTASLTWTASSSPILHSYTLKRSTINGGPYTVVASGLTDTGFADTIPPGMTCYYVVSGFNDGGEGADSHRLILNPPGLTKLTGTPIYGGSPIVGSNTAPMAFDGNLDTRFEINNDSGWVGLDLGASNTRTLTTIRYSPRNSSTGNLTNANFMINGLFQASPTADFSTGVVTLFAIPVAPAYSKLTSVALPSLQTPYRYVRYRTGAGKNANISELEIHGVSIPAAPTAVNLSNQTADHVTISWNAVPTAAGYHVKRSTDGVSPITIAAGLTALSFQDTGLDPQTVYHYVVSATNEAGDGPDSAEVLTYDGYARWLVANGRTPGEPNCSFDGDPDGDGIANGVAYMVPDGLKVGNSLLTAVVRQDVSVTTQLWKTTTLGDWVPETIHPATDQSGVAEGFVRMETTVTPLPGQPALFYRLGFTR